MIARLAILACVLAVAWMFYPAPSRDITQPLPLPLNSETTSQRGRSEFVTRMLGPQSSKPFAPFHAPLRVELLSAPGRADATISTDLASMFSVVQGSAIDPDAGELFVWGLNKLGEEMVLIAAAPKSLADVNADDAVTPADALDFLELFNAADPRADLNTDGVTTGTDVQLFLDDFLHSR